MTEQNALVAPDPRIVRTSQFQAIEGGFERVRRRQHARWVVEAENSTHSRSMVNLCDGYVITNSAVAQQADAMFKSSAQHADPLPYGGALT